MEFDASLAAAWFLPEERNEDADRLMAEPGPRRAAAIIASWAQQRAIREIMIFLHAHGVGTSRAVQFFPDLRPRGAAGDFRSSLSAGRDIHSVGFRSANAIAMKIGIEKTAMIRAKAGISFALTKALDDGHYGLPRDESRFAIASSLCVRKLIWYPL